MIEGWELKPLKDVCEKTNNINWKNNTEKLFQYIDLSAVSRETLTITESSKINSLTAPSRAKKIINENDVIFATTRPTLNRMAIISTEYNEDICSTGFTVLRAKVNIIEPKYIFYSLQVPSFMERMERMQRGASYPAVSDKDVKDFEIPIPPLKEQKQIVTTIDRAFKQIDQAKANLEKNLNNAKELFQSKLNEVFSQRGEGWEEKKLGDIAFIKSGGTPLRSKKEFWDNGNIPWYSSGELNHLYTKKSERYITNIGLKNSNAKLFPKASLLIGMYDTAALKMSILDRDATFNQAIAGIKPDKSLNLLFILYAINSRKPELLKERRGVRQKNLSLTKIKDIKLPIPNIEIQINVVNELIFLSDKINNLQTHYQQKLNNLEELKKSILQKAFKGELDYA